MEPNEVQDYSIHNDYFESNCNLFLNLYLFILLGTLPFSVPGPRDPQRRLKPVGKPYDIKNKVF